MNEFHSVELEFYWPEDATLANDTFNPGDKAEISWGFYGGSPFVPAVGEKVIFDNPVAKGTFLDGFVIRREYSYSTGSYQNRSECSITLYLTQVRRWVP